MEKIREQIYLGALLHDIGKFWQRADESFNKSKTLKDHIKNNTYLTNITQSGYSTHQHVFWTLQFLENKNSVFEKLGFNSVDCNIPNLAAYHHRPRNEWESFIQLADWWASGIDRSVVQEKYLIAHNQSEKYKKIPLVSVFSGLKVGENKVTTLKKCYNVKSLSIMDCMPNDYTDLNLNGQDTYNKLWILFNDEFDKLPKQNYRNFFVSLYYLLKKYLWFIPASTIDFPDSSLFQHSKLTAAFAQSFYDYQIEKEHAAFSFNSAKFRLSLNPGEFPVFLFGVDLSGIQSFLYNISSKYAAKSLRGRSFYLQMFIEGLSWKLIELTNATPSHIVYNSGGKFFMILPNTHKIKNQLAEFIKDTESNLWDEFEGQLSINYFSQPFAYDNLSDKSKPNIRIPGEKVLIYLGELWQRMHEGLSEMKNKKNRELFLERFDRFFVQTEDQGGKTNICSVTGKEISDDETLNVTNRLKGSEDENLNISLAVIEQKEIGEALVGHTHIALGEKFDRISHDVYALPFSYYFSVREKGFVPGDCVSAKTIFNDESFDFLVKEHNSAQGFRFFGGIDVPLNKNKKGKQKTFEELSGYYEENGNKIKENNYPRIGFLRMDVDNLGKIFMEGFDKKNQSFSAFATLSGMLDLFFSGYLNTLRQHNDFIDYITIVYSGGDDIFAVGRWDKIIEFAAAIRAKFKEFTGRQDISITGGIEIYPPKYPIAKASEASGNAEDKAKHFQENRKDAFCLFGIPIKWGEEWENVVKWKNKLLEWLEKDIISKGLLMALFRYYDIYQREIEKVEQAKKNGLIYNPDLSWKWNATYNLARRSKAMENYPEKRTALNELKTLIFTEINENRFRFEAFAVAMRWAELMYKMKSTKKYNKYEKT